MVQMTCRGSELPRKFQLMFLEMKAERDLRLNINRIKIRATREVKFLGVDNKLQFDNIAAKCLRTLSGLFNWPITMQDSDHTC